MIIIKANVQADEETIVHSSKKWVKKTATACQMRKAVVHTNNAQVPGLLIQNSNTTTPNCIHREKENVCK